jgi:hypothetical protein
VKEFMYTPSCTLDTQFTYRYEGEEYTTQVSGDLEHAMLYEGSRQFYNKYTSLYHIAGKKNLANTNYLNASIGFLYSDAPLDQGDPGELEFISYPYRLKQYNKKYMFRVMDLYKSETNFSQPGVYHTKAARNSSFNDHLIQHIANARLDDIDDYYSAKIDIPHEVQSSQFHEHHHHTEQGLMHSFYEADSMERIFKLIKQQKNMNSLVAIFVDAHTPRPMCACCNIGVVGFQNSHESGFMADFQQYLDTEHEDELGAQLPDDGLALRARISCTQHPSREAHGLHLRLDQSLVNINKPVKSKVTFRYDRPRQVVQAYVDQGIHDAMITDRKLFSEFWREDIFLSDKLPESRYNEYMSKKAPKV